MISELLTKLEYKVEKNHFPPVRINFRLDVDVVSSQMMLVVMTLQMTKRYLGLFLQETFELLLLFLREFKQLNQLKMSGSSISSDSLPVDGETEVLTLPTSPPPEPGNNYFA